MSTTARPDVKLAGSESKDKMYEPKHKKRLVRVLTVVAYVFSVSLAAITLSLFYIFLYNPDGAGKMAARDHRFENGSVRVDDDRLPNKTWLAPEEPRALPVQIAQPPQIGEDVAHLHSDEVGASWENQETYKALRNKRGLQAVLKVLKVAKGT